MNNWPTPTPRQVTSWLGVVLFAILVLTIFALAAAVVFWAWTATV